MIIYILAILFAFVIYIWKMRKFYYASFKMKGPTAFPLIGNYFDFLGSTEELHDKIEKLIQTHGTPMRVWLGTNFTVVVTHPEDFKVILNSSNALTKPTATYDFTSDLTENSVFSLKNILRWRSHRKLLELTFRVNVLNSFIPGFEKNALILCGQLGKETENGNIDDVHNALLVCTLNTLLETAMGLKQDIQLDMSRYANWILNGMEMITRRVFRIWHHPDIIYKFTKDGKQYKTVLKAVRSYNERIIKTKEAEYIENRQQTKQNKKKVFLDFLIEMLHETNQYTEKKLRDEVGSLLIAGSHSTALSSSWALMLLGMHPTIQIKLYDELQEIFGESERAITKQDIDNMKYLNMVIKEVLRLFPFGPLIGRTATQDLQLSTCFLPKGSNCILGIFHTHRDPKLWPNPLIFDPDRFLPEEIAKRHPYAWIPFSAGPRNCLGLKYAMMAMKVMLSSIVRKYRIHCEYKSVEEIKLKLDFTMMPVEGFRVALEARTVEK